VNDLRKTLAQTKTITFDCYGTLIDWKGGLAQSFRELFGRTVEGRIDELFGLYVEVEATVEGGPYRPYRDVLSKVAARLGSELGMPLSEKRAQALASMLPGWPPFPDTNEALTRLKRSFRLGVLSNIDRDLFAGTARQFPIEFDFVITAQDVRAYKPSQAHFRRMLETHGPKQSVLHVAQSLYHDGKPCGELDLAYAWINRYKQVNDTAIRPIAEFPDLISLARLADGEE